MKRIATIIVGLALVLPSTALAQTSATCQGYSQKVCNVSAVTQTKGPSAPAPAPDNSAVNAASNSAPATSSSGSLPFTGLDLGLLAVGGAVLLGTGLFVRRASRGLS